MPCAMHRVSFFVKKNVRKTIYHNLIIIYPLDDIPVGMIGVERQGLFFAKFL